MICVFWKVIEEIEEMMQESPDPEDDETPTQSDRLSMLSQEIQTLKRSSTSSYEESKKPSFSGCSLCLCKPQLWGVTMSRNLWFSQVRLHAIPLPSSSTWGVYWLLPRDYGILTWILYLYTRAVVTKYQRLGGLNHRKLIPYSSGSQMSEIRVSAGVISSEASSLCPPMDLPVCICILIFSFLRASETLMASF